MRPRLSGLAAAAAALAVTMAAGPADAVAVAAAESRELTAMTASPSPGSLRAILLINGDLVSAPAGDAGDRLSAVTTPGGGLARSVLTLGLGAKIYQIPAVALPYLGRGLDPGLFGISALLGAEAHGRLPVRVGYQGPPPKVPGITFTRTGRGSATGYLTAASAREFGTALIRQYLSDHSRGSYGTDGIFAHGTTISLAGTTAARAPVHEAAQAGYIMRTLTMHGTNLAGRPDTGDVVLVFNTDNSNLFDDPIESVNDFYHGTAKFSLPEGHYWAIGDFTEAAQDGAAASERLDVLPQFTVSKDVSIRLAERAASSQVTMTTPRPAVVAGTELELRRRSAAGPAVHLAWLETGALPLWISPTRKSPTVGSLQSFTDQWLSSPQGQPVRYAYDLAYQALGGTISGQRYLVRPRSLATIHMNYYADQPSHGWTHPYGAFRAQLEDYLSGPNIATRMPGRWTEYRTGNRSLIWRNYIYGSWVSRAQNSGFVDDALRVVRAGQQVNENWNAYPLHPAVNSVLLGSAGLPVGAARYLPYLLTTPSASRAGDMLTLDVTPFSDSQPGHTGVGFFPQYDASDTGTYQIDENGKTIQHGNAVTAAGGGAEFTTSVKLTPGPATIRFKLTASRAGADYPLSSASTTVWTWRSAHEAGARLPADWTCGDWNHGAPVSRDCRAEPLMTLGYRVAGMALDGSAPAGRQTLHLTVGHLQLAKAAPITSTTVQLSVDGGKTWHNAAVSGRAGQYTALYGALAGSFVTLRVSASDAAGGRITEIITRAYKIAA